MNELDLICIFISLIFIKEFVSILLELSNTNLFFLSAHAKISSMPLKQRHLQNLYHSWHLAKSLGTPCNWAAISLHGSSWSRDIQ